MATFSTAAAWAKPAAMIGDIALVGEVADGLLALGLVGDLELAIGDAGLGLELLGAVVHALVEGLVELAADVEDDGGLVVGRESSGRRHGNGGYGGEQITSFHCSLPDRFGWI